MRHPSTYHQFCPVARAAEIVGARWMPLVLRELLCGSTHFNDLRRGLPRMSPSLLAQRLRELARRGIVERVSDGARVEHRLTPAGEELRPIILALGRWGKRNLERELSTEEMDPSLLVWDMHRQVAADALPEERVVAQLDFGGVRGKRSRFWLIFERPAVDVCYQDPGQEPSLRVHADLRALIEVWMGGRSFASALSEGSLRLEGPRNLCRGFPTWFDRSVFAGAHGA